MDKRPIFVVDTNILVDYADIIPHADGKVAKPNEPLIDLTGAHIVIPSIVIRELMNFKKEQSGRGEAARLVLGALRNLMEPHYTSMTDIYQLQAPVEISETGQAISVLPIIAEVKERLPFRPSDDDRDGQIILTALVAAHLSNGGRYTCSDLAYVDGRLPLYGPYLESELSTNSVVLLTNDNGLAVRALERGIRTHRYGYKYPEPYTGRRDVVVPEELLGQLMRYNTPITLAEWRDAVPDVPRLVANEFVVLTSTLAPEDMCHSTLRDSEHYERSEHFRHIGRYDAEREQIVPLKYASQFPLPLLNAGQAIYAEALMSPQFSAVLCNGPAGSGKTFMATIYGYEACRNGDFIGVTVVPCENRSKIGALPGRLDEKMDPDVQPLKNALRNYLLKSDHKLKKDLDDMRKFGPSKKSGEDGNSIKAHLQNRVDLIWKNWFSSVPIELARGRDFAYELAIYDEFQDQNTVQADTLVKRIGHEGKIIITGDVWQIHAPYLDRFNNGLVYASAQLMDDPMVAQVHFTENEVVRHPLVKMIAERQHANAR